MLSAVAGLAGGKAAGQLGCRLLGSTALLEGNGRLLCSLAADGTTEIPHKNAVAASKVLSTIFFSHSSKLNSDFMMVLCLCGVRLGKKAGTM